MKRDIAVIALVTLCAAFLAARFELNELVFSLTRGYEHLQLDEWPIVMLVLAVSLTGLSWRRYRQAVLELQARQIAETKLAAALRENRELAHQNLCLLEQERKRLARELHDELGQYLNAIKLDAVALGENAERRDEPVAAASGRIVAAVDHVYAVVSDMIRRLRPAGLDELGLVAAIESCVDQWRQRLPHARFTLSASGDLEGLDELTSLTIYRAVQEGLTNAYKHAKATRIDVSLQRATTPREAAGGELVLTVSDDGNGADLQMRAPGFGLGGMRERVEMMGGKFSLHSAPGRGFSFEARIPSPTVT